MGSHNGLSRTTGLLKYQLGGVIFGAKKTTINECLSKNLFGLPSAYFEYVKKVEHGLPLFLFNYTDRTLLGIFEAVSSGQMNIEPCAWTSEGYRTPFTAQKLSSWLGIPSIYAFTVKDLLEVHNFINVSKERRLLIRMVIMAACWIIWKA